METSGARAAIGGGDDSVPRRLVSLSGSESEICVVDDDERRAAKGRFMAGVERVTSAVF